MHVQERIVSFEHCIIFIKLTKIWYLEEVDDPICRLVLLWMPNYYLVHAVPPGDRVNIAVKSSTQFFHMSPDEDVIDSKSSENRSAMGMRSTFKKC